VAVTFFAILAFVVHRKMHPIVMISEMDKSYRRGSRCSSTQDELYHSNGKNKPSDALMETHFTPTADYEDDGDPDLIPSSKNGKQTTFENIIISRSGMSLGMAALLLTLSHFHPPRQKIPLNRHRLRISVSLILNAVKGS